MRRTAFVTGASGFIGINLVLGFIFPGIDNSAHIGGLISGFFIGFIYNNYLFRYIMSYFMLVHYMTCLKAHLRPC